MTYEILHHVEITYNEKVETPAPESEEKPEGESPEEENAEGKEIKKDATVMIAHTDDLEEARVFMNSIADTAAERFKRNEVLQFTRINTGVAGYITYTELIGGIRIDHAYSVNEKADSTEESEEENLVVESESVTE